MPRPTAICHGTSPSEGAGRDELGRIAEEKEHDGMVEGAVESRMAAMREETAEKYLRIGVGQGDKCRFSIGFAAARHASDESMKKEYCILITSARY